MDHDRCGSCGAALARGAVACSLCHAPVTAAAVATVVVPQGQPEPEPPEVGPNGFLPAPPRQALRVDERQFSRVQQGPLSFGPLGRTVISVLMIAPIWFMWFMSGGGWVTLLFTIPTALLPLWYLRATWRSHRVR